MKNRKIVEKVHNSIWCKLKKDYSILENYSLRELIYTNSDANKLTVKEIDFIVNKLEEEFKN